jgi:hypothetical protein
MFCVMVVPEQPKVLWTANAVRRRHAMASLSRLRGISCRFAGAEFDHGPTDVGAGGCRAYVEPLGDLVVGESAGHETEDESAPNRHPEAVLGELRTQSL